MKGEGRPSRLKQEKMEKRRTEESLILQSRLCRWLIVSNCQRGWRRRNLRLRRNIRIKRCHQLQPRQATHVSFYLSFFISFVLSASHLHMEMRNLQQAFFNRRIVSVSQRLNPKTGFVSLIALRRVAFNRFLSAVVRCPDWFVSILRRTDKGILTSNSSACLLVSLPWLCLVRRLSGRPRPLVWSARQRWFQYHRRMLNRLGGWGGMNGGWEGIHHRLLRMERPVCQCCTKDLIQSVNNHKLSEGNGFLLCWDA